MGSAIDDELLEKFLLIAYRKVMKLDEYGDENWMALEKEVWTVIGKVAYLEYGLDSADIRSLRLKNPTKLIRYAVSGTKTKGTRLVDKRTPKARLFSSRANELEEYLTRSFKEYHAKRKSEEEYKAYLELHDKPEGSTK